MFFGKRFSSYHSDSLSGIEILVLSIIKNNNGTTGYDIIQKIKEKFGGMWHASAGTIYPLLSRLADKNLIKIQEPPESPRLKKIYFITSEGEKELQKLDKDFTISVNSLKDYIQVIFKAIPEMKAKTEVTFCNFPYQLCHGSSHRDEVLDISQRNIDKINRVLRQLSGRVESIKEEIRYHEDLLVNILKKREESRRSIDIEDDYIS